MSAICDPDSATFEHPELGRLDFAHSAYDLNDSLNRGFRMVTYVPVDGTSTREKVHSYFRYSDHQLPAAAAPSAAAAESDSS